MHDSHPCAGAPGYTCSTLDVPLDHTGKHGGTLHLQVGEADNAKAPRGVLLVLAGGPGQPGVPALSGFVPRALGALQQAYRIVMYDQRGTGGGALDCTELQQAVGTYREALGGLSRLVEDWDAANPGKPYPLKFAYACAIDDSGCGSDINQPSGGGCGAANCGRFGDSAE